MLTKDDFKQAILDFACEKYKKRFKEFYDKFFDEFPYDYHVEDDDQYFKNFIEWLIIEKPLPETGKTIAEEFIEENSKIIPEDLKQCMLKMKNVIRGKFKIISLIGKDLTLEAQDTNKKYKVKLYDTIDTESFKKSILIIGRIHEFDECYRFSGIFNHVIPESYFKEKRKKDKIKNYKLGELVTYVEIFGQKETLEMQIDDKKYIVLDEYCVIPDCNCTQVNLFFSEINDKYEPRGSEFLFLYNYQNKNLENLENIKYNHASEIVNNFTDKTNDQFKKRHEKIKEELKPHVLKKLRKYNEHKTLKLIPKIGRNEPCYCGSGKKFKKCCLDKDKE